MKRAAVDTLLGLHSRVAPNACHAPSSWPGEAFIAKHGVHDGSTLSAREATVLRLNSLVIAPIRVNRIVP